MEMPLFELPRKRSEWKLKQPAVKKKTKNVTLSLGRYRLSPLNGVSMGAAGVLSTLQRWPWEIQEVIFLSELIVDVLANTAPPKNTVTIGGQKVHIKAMDYVFSNFIFF